PRHHPRRSRPLRRPPRRRRPRLRGPPRLALQAHHQHGPRRRLGHHLPRRGVPHRPRHTHPPRRPARPARTPVQPRPGPMRFLVAEAHPSLARSLADGLRDEGYAVDLTFDGAEAHRWAAKEPYDCLVLDIMLPTRDGLNVVESLRRAGSTTPVLLLTARD